MSMFGRKKPETQAFRQKPETRAFRSHEELYRIAYARGIKQGAIMTLRHLLDDPAAENPEGPYKGELNPEARDWAAQALLMTALVDVDSLGKL